jgi:ribosomal protein S12 methylthiotransferase
LKELLLSRRTRPSTASTQARGARRLLRLNTVKRHRWIRLLYLYPTISADVIRAMADCKVCNYIDLPLQHASDPILAG